MALFALKKEILLVEEYLRQIQSKQMLVVIYLVNSEQPFDLRDNCVYQAGKVGDEVVDWQVDSRESRMPPSLIPNLPHQHTS